MLPHVEATAKTGLPFRNYFSYDIKLMVIVVVYRPRKRKSLWPFWLWWINQEVVKETVLLTSEAARLAILVQGLTSL
jgi:hypothetical protein